VREREEREKPNLLNLGQHLLFFSECLRLLQLFIFLQLCIADRIVFVRLSLLMLFDSLRDSFEQLSSG
jgi:hypothetical protein